MKDSLSKLIPIDLLPGEQVSLIPIVQEQVLSWQKTEGRNSLPWKTTEPYKVWISEVMLQQTQVSTGLIRYPRWLSRFPDVQSLALATEDEVLSEWEGLGYYARARNVHKAAQQIFNLHNGVFPVSRAERLGLPGVGPSTASAIGAFAYGFKESIFDGNVSRVWSRWWGDLIPESKSVDLFLWSWAQAVMPDSKEDVRSWTQGIMDLGATICTPKNPQCFKCPINTSCRAYALGKQDFWPIKKSKIKIKEIDLHWNWVVRNSKVAVVRRPTNGIWGGLWTPVDLNGENVVEFLANGNHKLSHRKISWKIGRSSVSDIPSNWEWVSADELDLMALPQPLRKWWSSLSDEARQSLFKE